MDRGRSRRLILAAAAAGLIFRLLFGLVYWTGKPLTHDEREYLTLAQSLAEGRGLHYPPGYAAGTSPQFGRAPGYPAFLAVIGTGPEATSTPVRVKVVQAVLGAIVVWMIGMIGRAAAGGRTGVIAAAIAAVYPPLVWIPAYVLSETLFMPLALGCVMLLQEAQAQGEGEHRGGERGATVAAGLVAGAAILVRPGMLLFLPIAAVWLVRRQRWSRVVAFGVSALVVVLPWTLRNAREYGRLVPVAAEGGVTFWTGNHPLAIGEGDLAANPSIKRAEIEFRSAYPDLAASELEPLYYRDAFAHIRSHPAWWAGLLAKKAFYTFVPIGPSYTLHSTRYRLASVVPYAVLAPLALIGLVRLAHHGGAATPLLLLALSVVVTGLIFFPQERFRIPVIDPTVIICASAVMAARVDRRT